MKRIDQKRLGGGYSYYGDRLCPSGYTRNQGWVALLKAWKGFVVKKSEDDIEGMHRYAIWIRELEKDLGISIYPFQDLKLAAVEYANDPENHSLLEEKAAELDKDPDELSSQDVLDIMIQQDKYAYDILNS